MRAQGSELEFRNLIAVRRRMERGLADYRAALTSVVAQVIKLIDAELGS
ncbi:MAG: hypothetical protein WEE89_10255 [Gemmatimonadota bacterium]